MMPQHHQDTLLNHFHVEIDAGEELLLFIGPARSHSLQQQPPHNIIFLHLKLPLSLFSQTILHVMSFVYIDRLK